MSEERVYVPALKWKLGEQSALRGLSSGVVASIAPLIEMIPPERPAHTKTQKNKGEPRREAKPIGDKAPGDIKAIKDSWAGGAFYLDAGLAVRRSDCGTVPLYFDLARSQGLAAIPVATLGSPYFCLKEIKAVCAKDKRGLAIRVPCPRDEMMLPFELSALSGAFGLSWADVDVIIDCQCVSQVKQGDWLRNKLVAAISGIRASISPRNLIVLAGSIPVTLGPLAVGRTPLLRIEWLEYLGNRSTIAPIYAFGDYAINTPVYKHGGSSGPPNIRYAEAANHLIFKGLDESVLVGGDPKSKFHRIHDLAADVMADSAWRTGTYSAGDQQIADAAAHKAGPGTQWSWRAAGTSTHITFVVEQLTKLGAPAASVLRLP